MSKNNKISNFDRNEKFNYENTPYHFDSVSAEGLKELENECAATIRDKFNDEYKPATIHAMLQIINGKFNVAYSELEGDYNARKTNLENAYSEGKKNLYDRIERFKLLVNEHNLTFDQYSESLEHATGRKPDENLRFAQSELEKLENNFKKLERK